MQLFTFYASLYQISFLYSVARMNQPQCVIHDSLVACISMHDGTSQGTKKSAVIFPCISDNVSSTVKSVIHFECSVQLVARMIQPRYVIHRFPRSVHLDARRNHARNEKKCGDFSVHFRQRIIHRQERYSFRM